MNDAYQALSLRSDTAEDRRKSSRARRRKGRLTLRVDADEVASEELIAGFGLNSTQVDIHASASTVWALLVELDALATCRNMRAANVLLSLLAELRTSEAR